MSDLADGHVPATRSSGVVYAWRDAESEAVGWVVVRSIFNGLSASPSIRMEPALTLGALERSSDYANYMSAVLTPQIGCTVAGICFSPDDARHKEVLMRFLIAHELLLRTYWVITNARSHTTLSIVLHELKVEMLLEKSWRMRFPNSSISSVELAKRLEEAGTKVEDLLEVAGGDVMCAVIKTTLSLAGVEDMPRVIVQGYSKEAQALLYLFGKRRLARVVAMADDVGFIHDETGIDVGAVLDSCTVDRPRFFGQLSSDQRDSMHGVAAGKDLEPFFASEPAEIVCLSTVLTDKILTMLLRTTWKDIPPQRRFLFFIGNHHPFPATDLFVFVPNWVTNSGEEQFRRTLITLEKSHAASPVLARQILEDTCASISHFLRSAFLVARKNTLLLGQACRQLASERLLTPLAFGTLQESRKILERSMLVDTLMDRLLILFDSVATPKNDDLLEHTVHDILQKMVLPKTLASVYLVPTDDGERASKGVLLRTLRGIAQFLSAYRVAVLAAKKPEDEYGLLVEQRPKLSIQNQTEILIRFLDHQHLPLSPNTVEMAIDQMLGAHRYLALALSFILESAETADGEAAPQADEDAEAAPSSKQMASDFGVVLTEIISELLKIGRTSGFTQWIGRTVMFFGGNQLGALLESQLEKGPSIRNDIHMVEFFTRVAQTPVDDDFAAKFFKDLPDRLMKLLPSQVPQDATRRIASSLIDIVKQPQVIRELLYFYILPQFCEGTIYFHEI